MRSAKDGGAASPTSDYETIDSEEDTIINGQQRGDSGGGDVSFRCEEAAVRGL